MPDLRDADLNTLVLESGRRIEALAREVNPDAAAPDGKPLLLGERMRLLRAHFGEEDWRAFRSWSRARNAYVHAEENAVPDIETFHTDYLRVVAALRAVVVPDAPLDGARPDPPQKKKRARRSTKPKPRADATPGVAGPVLLAVSIVTLLLAYQHC